MIRVFRKYFEGLDTIRAQAVKSIANINFRDNIRNFAGVRAGSRHW